MRDEHLLLAILVLLALDVAILLPWTLVDPIVCKNVATYTEYKVSILRNDSE